MSFRCIKAFMHAFSGRFSRTCLEGISFNFFVCFIFNVSLGSAPKRKNFDIQRNTRVGSGGQFTSNRLSNDHIYIEIFFFKCQIIQIFQQTLNDRYHLWTRIQLKSCVTIHLTHYGISPQESQYCISGSLKRNLTEENISKLPRTHTQLMPNVYLKEFLPLVMICGYWLSIISFLTCFWSVIFLLKVKSWFLILCYR